MLDTVKKNPVPSIIAGLSVGWLVAKSTDSSSSRSGDRHYYDEESRHGSDYERDYRRMRARRQTDPDYRERYEPVGYEEEYRHEYDDEEESTREAVKEKASEATERVRERTSEAADQARETARRSKETARRYSRRAQRQAESATNQAGRWIENNPLAAGAATFALGAFAGLALPGTRREDEFMGEASDRTMHRAKSTAKEATQRAKHVAEEAGKEAKETAKKEAKREKEEMQNST